MITEVQKSLASSPTVNLAFPFQFSFSASAIWFYLFAVWSYVAENDLVWLGQGCVKSQSKSWFTVYWGFILKIFSYLFLGLPSGPFPSGFPNNMFRFTNIWRETRVRKGRLNKSVKWVCMPESQVFVFENEEHHQRFQSNCSIFIHQ